MIRVQIFCFVTETNNDDKRKNRKKIERMNSKDAQRPDQKWHPWSICVQEKKKFQKCVLKVINMF